jgi:hypothetical protein
MKTYNLNNKDELEAAAKDSGLPLDLLSAIRIGMIYGSNKVQCFKENPEDTNVTLEKFNKSAKSLKCLKSVPSNNFMLREYGHLIKNKED